MTLEDFKEYCLEFKEVTLEFPFDEKILVCKVRGKMFALTDIEDFEYINVKCDPEEALVYRDAFEGVTPGYHMNKKHWNSVYVGKDVSDEQIREWIGDSYDLVVSKLPRKDRDVLSRKGLGA
ncbi:MAG: MmcQ/YjbR family DNA-binding protein [Spirochaetales bacterium]|nr:MmcQ/YjbR family DNA-binding protein [Spirochaetales bacterium]